MQFFYLFEKHKAFHKSKPVLLNLFGSMDHFLKILNGPLHYAGIR